jgi:hypothetical protein
MDVLVFTTPKCNKRAIAQCPDAPKKPRLASRLEAREPPLLGSRLWDTPTLDLLSVSMDQNEENRSERDAGADDGTTTNTTTTMTTNIDTIHRHDVYSDGSTVDTVTVIETITRQTTTERPPAAANAMRERSLFQ